MSTVKSTENRIFNFSVMESLLMISMAGLQVFIVRFFFQGARKGQIPTQLLLANLLIVCSRICMKRLTSSFLTSINISRALVSIKFMKA